MVDENRVPAFSTEKCRGCGTDLIFIEKTKCYRCPRCNPVGENKPTEQPLKKGDPDLAILEKKIKAVIKKVVPALIREELENWYIQKLSVTKTETMDLTGSEQINVNPEELISTTPETWRQKAKRLGVPMYDNERKCPRKKVDVLKDIEERTVVVSSD